MFIKLEMDKKFDCSVVGNGIVTIIFRDNEVFSHSDLFLIPPRADAVFHPPDLEVSRAIWLAKHVDSTPVQVISVP